MYKGFQPILKMKINLIFTAEFTETLCGQGFQYIWPVIQCPSEFQRNITKIYDYQNEFAKVSTLNAQVSSVIGNQ